LPELNEHQLAEGAQRVLDDPAFLQIVKNLEDRYYADWRSTLPEASAKREQIFASLKALDDLVGAIRSKANAVKVTSFNNNLRSKQK
jgi:hypothetical protein